MKTLKTFLVVVAMMMVLPMSAQTTVVKGILVDSLSQESIPYATVRIYKDGKMDKPVAMSLTDLEGRFSQEVKEHGKMVLTINSVGIRPVNRRFTSAGSTVRRVRPLVPLR